ncbi:MAG: signal peptidase I [Nitrososphaeria archaeon]|nr:signal peptidase I [Nitrososphaeria archaeon]
MRLKPKQRRLIVNILAIAIPILSAISVYFGLRIALATTTPFVAVASGSMRPALETGDLVIIQGVPATSIHKEDIIAFESPSEYERENVTRIWQFTVYTVHRVVKAQSFPNGTILFTTKGDDNDNVDSRPVPDYCVHGRVIYRIPYLGYIILDPTVTITIVIIGVIIILVWPEKKRRFRRRKHT